MEGRNVTFCRLKMCHNTEISFTSVKSSLKKGTKRNISVTVVLRVG